MMSKAESGRRYDAVLTLLFISILVLGCANSRTSQNSDTKANSTAVTGRKPARLLVQIEPRGNTGVYQQHLQVISPLMVDGKAAEGQHSLEVNNTASFKGKTPSCISEKLAFLITHTTPTKTGWHYPPTTRVIVLADGQPFKPVKVIQNEPENEDGEYRESLIIQPECEMYAKLSKATAVEIKIGNASVVLSEDEIADFRKFAEAIGFKLAARIT